MAAAQFYVPFSVGVASNGLSAAGARLHFYKSGTTRAAAVYTAPNLATAHENPVVANAAGNLPAIYLDEKVEYRLVIKNALGAVVDDLDPYIAGTPVGATAPGFPERSDRIVNILSYQENTVPGKTDFRAALIKAIADKSFTATGFDQPAAGGIFFPAGEYYFSDQVVIDKTVIIQGVDSGAPGTSGGHATIFRAAANRGILYFRHEATGGTTSAAGSHVRNIFMVGSGTSTTTAGIYSTCRIFVQDVGAEGFGNGIHVHGELNPADRPSGEASLFRIIGGRFTGNRNAGIKITGGDANAFVIQGSDCVANANWGVENRSFLGGLIEGCHASINGVIRLAGRTLHSCCTYSGQRWAVVAGQEAAASTQAPGTGSAWRSDFNSEGLPAGSPSWTPRQTWLAGGSYLSSSPAGHGNTLISCYSESGQGPAQIQTSPGFALGGTHGAGVIGLIITGHDGSLLSSGGFKAAPSILFGQAKGVAELEWGTDSAAQYGSLSYFGHGLAGKRFHIAFQRDKAHLAFGIQNLAAAWEITSDTTNFQFGRGAAQPGKMLMPEVFLGAETNARSLSFGSATPTAGSHAKGDVIFNDGTNSGNDGIDYWRCIASGAPGTWIARP